MEFISKHNLQFLSRPFKFAFELEYTWNEFVIGTCFGLWRSTDTSYQILAVNNREPGNGHFDDVIEWFEQSCKRDKKDLVFLEMLSQNFADHLKTKRGFEPHGADMIKTFKQMK